MGDMSPSAFACAPLQQPAGGSAATVNNCVASLASTDDVSAWDVGSFQGSPSKTYRPSIALPTHSQSGTSSQEEVDGELETQIILALIEKVSAFKELVPPPPQQEAPNANTEIEITGGSSFDQGESMK